MAEDEEGAGTATPRQRSQRAPEGMRVEGEDVCRKGSAACSGRTRSNNVGIETFIARQGVSSGKVGDSGLIEGEEDVRTVPPQRGSKRTAEGLHVKRSISGKPRKRRTDRLDVVQKWNRRRVIMVLGHG